MGDEEAQEPLPREGPRDTTPTEWKKGVTRSLRALQALGDRIGPSAVFSIAIGYVGIVLSIGHSTVPGASTDLHFIASRDLDTNTRVLDDLLVSPPIHSLEDRLSLASEKQLILGKYVRRLVRRGGAIKSNNVDPWPTLKTDEVTPVEIDSVPDWMTFNQGTKVEVWSGDKGPQHATVLAIVPSNKKWLVLLPTKAIASKVPTTSKEARTLRIEGLP